MCFNDWRSAKKWKEIWWSLKISLSNNLNHGGINDTHEIFNMLGFFFIFETLVFTFNVIILISNAFVFTLTRCLWKLTRWFDMFTIGKTDVLVFISISKKIYIPYCKFCTFVNQNMLSKYYLSMGYTND